MAHFAELDQLNRVIRTVVACNDDIANNGGEQSEQAAEHFKTVCPLSPAGIKYVQTSYNHNFRGHFAGIGMIFREDLNMFIDPQPYASWTLDAKGNWNAPVPKPETYTQYGDIRDMYKWDEENQTWVLVTI
jgi:hypothetical protein